MAMKFHAAGALVLASTLLLAPLCAQDLPFFNLLPRAGSLLVSAVDHLIGAGLLPALVDPLWNSSWLLDDGSRVGSWLAALAGYRAHPSLMLVILYAVYWWGMLRAMRPARRDA